jgi:hypothetical protein
MVTTPTRLMLALLAACAAPACDSRSGNGGGASQPPVIPRPESTTQPSARPADQLDVIEAVFRHQFGKNASAGQWNVDYFFLSLAGGADPPAALLARFKDEKPKVLPVSLVGPDQGTGVKHKELGGRGLIFFVHDIRWLGPDEAEVGGGYYEANLSSSGNTYRVERRGGKWAVTDDTLNVIS